MANLTPITQEQIDRCERIIDESTNTVFYQVQSEHTDAIYEVRYNREYHCFTCTCKAGQEGFIHCAHGTCNHCRWAVAAEAEYQQYKRNERAAQARIEATEQYRHEQAEHALVMAEINLK